jgi:hypothetical protein
MGETEHDGYVPDGLGIGGGDYIELHWCMDCGQVQGEFPLPCSELDTSESPAGPLHWHDPGNEDRTP